MNLAGKAGGCGYEQTYRIGNRADGAGANLDADPRWRTNAAGPSRVHTIARGCCDNRRCDPVSHTDSFEYRYAYGRSSSGQESRCDCERCGWSGSCDGERGAITNAIDRPRAVSAPFNSIASHNGHSADARSGRNSDNRQHDYDDRLRIDSSGSRDDSGRATVVEPARADGLPDARNRSRLLRPTARLQGRPVGRPYRVEGRERAHSNRHTGGRADRRRRDQPAFALDGRRPIFIRG